MLPVQNFPLRNNPPPLRGVNREGPGAPLAQPTKAKAKERKVQREGLGKEEEGGHEVVRGRWAPPPMEGKGPREGQRLAISQLALPAADENNTPRRHATPTPAPGTVEWTCVVCFADDAAAEQY